MVGNTSPASKRSKIESPTIPPHTPLALPGSSWKPPSTPSANPTTTKTNPTSTASSSTAALIAASTGSLGLTSSSASTSAPAAGLQFGGSSGNSANKSIGGGAHADVLSPTAADERPMASGSGSGVGLSGPSNSQTDFAAINDAVGISGVDIAAEEELARQQSVMYGRGGGRTNFAQGASQSWSGSAQQVPQRVKIMDFLDKPALTVMVQHIAASYQLKTLEPAILDVLTQAAESRIHSLLIDAIAAKEHRLGSSHLRPPPLYPSSPPKGKQREAAGAMYDQLIYDEPERVLSMLARVEGEEERKARLERAGSSGAEAREHPPAAVAEPSRPPEQARKEKKRKREGPGQQAKNMSDDARARQSNQTAMRSVGGRTKYSWLSGGIVAPRAAPSSTAAIMAALPAPKFAPQSTRTGSNGRPQSTTADPGGGGGSRATTITTTATKKDGLGIGNRLGGIVVPGVHLGNHHDQEHSRIGLKDCLFALERERGSGAGRGSGSRTLFKTYVVGRPKE